MRLVAVVALLASGVALAADVPYAVVTTATTSAACAVLPKGHRVTVQCTTDSIVTIAQTNGTTALVEGETGTFVLLRALYDTSATEQFSWGCATAATAAGKCLFMRVAN